MKLLACIFYRGQVFASEAELNMSESKEKKTTLFNLSNILYNLESVPINMKRTVQNLSKIIFAVFEIYVLSFPIVGRSLLLMPACETQHRKQHTLIFFKFWANFKANTY